MSPGLDYSRQIVRTEAPLNAEPPLDSLSADFVTPIELFYIRNHGSVPVIDLSDYRLIVDGEVETRLTLSFDEIRKDFAYATTTATLQCAGNRRNEMSAIEPIAGEVPWGAAAIGNALWGGLLLKDILIAAGARSDARHVAFVGRDEIEKSGQRIGFGASIAIEKAMHGDTLLAYHMNGAPLDAIHGFPLRAVVPGFIGARSVKWLDKITVQCEPSRNFYQAQSYKMFPPHITARTADWEHGRTLEDTEINSVICVPADGETVTAGSLQLRGYAIGSGGTTVDRVEISVDGGTRWVAATLVESRRPWSWCLWEVGLELKSGAYEIVARASDAHGNAQPEDGGATWNFKGYAHNAWHRVRLTVR